MSLIMMLLFQGRFESIVSNLGSGLRLGLFISATAILCACLCPIRGNNMESMFLSYVDSFALLFPHPTECQSMFFICKALTFVHYTGWEGFLCVFLLFKAVLLPEYICRSSLGFSLHWMDLQECRQILCKQGSFFCGMLCGKKTTVWGHSPAQGVSLCKPSCNIEEYWIKTLKQLSPTVEQ